MRLSGLKSKQMAAASVFTALMVVLVYLSALFPTMSLSIIAVAGVISAVIVSEFGLSAAVMAYICASVLSLLLVPDKSNALLFALMFGVYPIIQNLAERVKHKWFTWVIKIASANLIFAIVWFLFKNLFFTQTDKLMGICWLLWAAVNVIFVMYDICLKKLVIFYKIRFANRVG